MFFLVTSDVSYRPIGPRADRRKDFDFLIQCIRKSICKSYLLAGEKQNYFRILNGANVKSSKARNGECQLLIRTVILLNVDK
jgi:hypothetical protein